MVAPVDRGQTSTGKASGSGRYARLTRLFGDIMAGNKKPKRSNGKRSRSSQAAIQAASTISMATQNLINMVTVTAVSGAVLLGLLAARHF